MVLNPPRKVVLQAWQIVGKKAWKVFRTKIIISLPQEDRLAQPLLISASCQAWFKISGSFG